MKRKKKVNSNRKGKRGERMWAKYCQDRSFVVRRTQQYCGNTGDASDCVGLNGFHQEVKNTEKLRLYDAMNQAIRDKKPGLIPILIHKQNHKPWLITMLADDWLELNRKKIEDFNTVNVFE